MGQGQGTGTAGWRWPPGETVTSAGISDLTLPLAMIFTRSRRPAPVSRSSTSTSPSTRGVPTEFENSGGAAPVPPSDPCLEDDGGKKTASERGGVGSPRDGGSFGPGVPTTCSALLRRGTEVRVGVVLRDPPITSRRPRLLVGWTHAIPALHVMVGPNRASIRTRGRWRHDLMIGQTTRLWTLPKRCQSERCSSPWEGRWRAVANGPAPGSRQDRSNPAQAVCLAITPELTLSLPASNQPPPHPRNHFPPSNHYPIRSNSSGFDPQIQPSL